MLSLCGPHGLSMSSVFCSQDRTIISRICTYRLIFVTEAHCLVYEVGTELINAISINPGLKTLTVIQASETEHADRHGLLINNTRSQWIRSNKARLLFLLFMLWLRYGAWWSPQEVRNKMNCAVYVTSGVAPVYWQCTGP